ncbi:MAG: RHS repeat-associated core domain-containing protein [Bacteroidales bacterium]|nr:RHS repeat-associated core domain-containing protein [Bacteroidales bacterium]MBP7875128.1 RHS repeat-associated core domain-containing protein [Bacteroidales bacterium]
MGQPQTAINIEYNSRRKRSLLQELSFDAWGDRRNSATWRSFTGTPPEPLFDRGFTGHEHLYAFGLINMNGRMYDPLASRMLSPDNFIQAPDFSQSFNRYSYCLNNPLKYTDPDGEFVHIIIGAAIGDVINLGIKAYQGKINSWSDGLMAFRIGAAAGAVGAATGGAAFLAAGGGAAGAGGFLAGAAGGMVGSAFASPIQSIGNSMYFGDPMMTGEQYLMGIAIGGLVGGTINGGIALVNGKTFMTGDIRGTGVPTPGSTPTLKFDEPEVKLNTNGMRSQLAQMPEENSFTLRTTTTETPNYSIEGQSIKISMQRPDITGYDASLAGKTDLYHSFPTLLDKTIVQQGAWVQRIKDAAFWFEAPGTINGTQGVYTIGVNQQGVIFHRCFYPY